jgi:hypothetical protein
LKIATDLQSEVSSFQASIIREAATTTNAHNVREMLVSMRDSTNITTSDINAIVHQMHLHTGSSTVPPVTSTAPVPPVVVAKTKIERLRELRELLECGEITQLEYDLARADILRS